MNTTVIEQSFDYTTVSRESAESLRNCKAKVFQESVNELTAALSKGEALAQAREICEQDGAPFRDWLEREAETSRATAYRYIGAFSWVKEHCDDDSDIVRMFDISAIYEAMKDTTPELTAAALVEHAKDGVRVTKSLVESQNKKLTIDVKTDNERLTVRHSDDNESRTSETTEETMPGSSSGLTSVDENDATLAIDDASLDSLDADGVLSDEDESLTTTDATLAPSVGGSLVTCRQCDRQFAVHGVESGSTPIFHFCSSPCLREFQNGLEAESIEHKCQFCDGSGVLVPWNGELPAELDNDQFRDAWASWIAYRKRRRLAKYCLLYTSPSPRD